MSSLICSRCMVLYSQNYLTFATLFIFILLHSNSTNVFEVSILPRIIHSISILVLLNFVPSSQFVWVQISWVRFRKLKNKNITIFRFSFQPFFTVCNSHVFISAFTIIWYNLTWIKGLVRISKIQSMPLPLNSIWWQKKCELPFSITYQTKSHNVAL